MQKKRITIWGTSFKKVADEAQLLAHYKIITSHCPEAEVVFITKSREEIAQKYPAIKIIPFSRPFSAVTALINSDLLVIGGGPFFDDAGQLLKCAVLIAFAKLNRIPILVYGVTIFPIQTWWGKMGYRILLSLVDKILVRDHVAHKSLVDIGLPPKSIRVGIDLRYMLDSAGADQIKQILIREGIDLNKPIISISTRYFDSHMPTWVKNTHGFDEQKAANASRAFARAINDLGQFGQLVLIPMHPGMHEDIETARCIQHEMDHPDKLIVLNKRYQVNEILGIIQASQLFITARVGSILFSSLAATPVLAVAYDQRTNELMHELGMQEYVFNWQTLEQAKIVAAAQKLIQRRNEISQLLEIKVGQMRRTAEQDSKLYHEMLS